jgi:hypothetical protein
VPSSTPKVAAPTRPPITPSAPASTIQGASRGSALRITVKQSGATIKATRLAQAASPMMGAEGTAPKIAVPDPIAEGHAEGQGQEGAERARSIGPRPSARWRVASSVMAVVSVRPGSRTMSPATVAVSTDIGPSGWAQADRRGAHQERGQRLEHPADPGQRADEQREDAEPEPQHRARQNLPATAPEEHAGRPGQKARRRPW